MEQFKAWRPGYWITNSGICVSWPHMKQLSTPELLRQAAAARTTCELIKRIMQ